MREDLKTFAAVFAQWTGPEFRIVTLEFRIGDEKDSLEIAKDMAVLEGSELIYLFRVLSQWKLIHFNDACDYSEVRDNLS